MSNYQIFWVNTSIWVEIKNQSLDSAWVAMELWFLLWRQESLNQLLPSPQFQTQPNLNGEVKPTHSFSRLQKKEINLTLCKFWILINLTGCRYWLTSEGLILIGTNWELMLWKKPLINQEWRPSSRSEMGTTTHSSMFRVSLRSTSISTRSIWMYEGRR